MSALQALKAARDAGVRVRIDGDALTLDANAAPPPAVLDLLTVHKPGVIALPRTGSKKIPLRKADLRSVIERVEVDDHVIRIVGDKATLQEVIAGGAVAANGVRGFVPKWRAP